VDHRDDHQPFSIAERGYRRLRTELDLRGLTGIFRQRLFSNPGFVEDLTGELSQLFCGACLIHLNNESHGMEQDHQLPSLPCFAVGGWHDFSHLGSHDGGIAIQDFHKTGGHCVSLW
jgi:hypothetical protein